MQGWHASEGRARGCLRRGSPEIACALNQYVETAGCLHEFHEPRGKSLHLISSMNVVPWAGRARLWQLRLAATGDTNGVKKHWCSVLARKNLAGLPDVSNFLAIRLSLRWQPWQSPSPRWRTIRNASAIVISTFALAGESAIRSQRARTEMPPNSSQFGAASLYGRALPFRAHSP